MHLSTFVNDPQCTAFILCHTNPKKSLKCFSKFLIFTVILNDIRTKRVRTLHFALILLIDGDMNVQIKPSCWTNEVYLDNLAQVITNFNSVFVGECVFKFGENPFCNVTLKIQFAWIFCCCEVEFFYRTIRNHCNFLLPR